MANLNVTMSEADLELLPPSLREKYLNSMAEEMAGETPKRGQRSIKPKYTGVKPITAAFAAKTRPVQTAAKAAPMAADAVNVGNYTAQLVDLGPKFNNARRIVVEGLPWRARSFKPGQMRALFANPDALMALQMYLEHLEETGYFGTDSE